jgi:hypothetical protein
MTDFDNKCKDIGCYFPLQRKYKPKPGDPSTSGESKERTPAILSEENARRLAAALLKAANGPIRFQQLSAEARRHVVLTMRTREGINNAPKEEDPGVQGRELADRAYEAWLYFKEEVGARADRIWIRVEKSSHGKLMCLYVLPKHFMKAKVKLEKFGAPQRVSEDQENILAIFAEELTIEPLISDKYTQVADQVGEDPMGRLHRDLIAAVAEQLLQWCAEKGLDWRF